MEFFELMTRAAFYENIFSNQITNLQFSPNFDILSNFSILVLWEYWSLTVNKMCLVEKCLFYR